MQLSIDQTRWLLKVLQPERTLGSLPGASALSADVRAALIGLPTDVYSTEQRRMLEGVKDAARDLLGTPGVAELLDRLPVKHGSRVVVFGDSHTSDPQSWAMILDALLASRGVSLALNAAPRPDSIRTSGRAATRLGAVLDRYERRADAGSERDQDARRPS